MKILTRYLLGEIIPPFFLCLLSCCSLWVIADLFGTLDEFLEYKISTRLLFEFYLTQLPRILLQMLPATLLFANLYTLLRLSRHRELISIQAGGAHPLRIFAPFFMLGGVVTVILFILSVQYNGPAEVRRQQILREIRGQSPVETQHKGVIYRDEAGRRIWYFQTLDEATGKGANVELLQFDDQHRDAVKYYANTGEYNGTFWHFGTVKRTAFHIDGGIAHQEVLPSLDLPDVTTPAKTIVEVDPLPEQMNLWQIEAFLNETPHTSPRILAPYWTQAEVLIAQSSSALVLLLFAMSLGISPVRRSPGVGVFNSMFVLVGFLFLTSLFHAMGRGYRLPAFIAAWSPPLLFAAVGVALLGRQFGWKIIPPACQRFYGMLRAQWENGR